jgi:hypothetical protein
MLQEVESTELASRIVENLETMAQSVNNAPELMNSTRAAEFLGGMSYDSFRRLAPSLKRHKVGGKIVYSRRELLAWALEQPPW